LAPSNRDRISVDLHGLKAALAARARAERVGVSVVVRRAVERELGLQEPPRGPDCDGPPAIVAPATVRVSLRLTATEAEQLATRSRREGVSRGACVADLLAGVLPPEDSASRPDRLTALNASCAELSTLSRNLHHLTALLRQSQVRAAAEYRDMLDTLGADVRKHLSIAAGLLAELRPPQSARFALRQRRRFTTPTAGDDDA
jgi:hypothetical protein